MSWILLSVVASAAQPLVPRTPLTVSAVRAPSLQAPHAYHLLTVKFDDSARARVGDDGRLVFWGDGSPEKVNALADAWAAHFQPRIRLPAQTLSALEQRAAARSGRAQPDLGGMMVVVVDADPGELEALGEALQALPGVERAHITEAFPAPPADIAPTTPDYTAKQSYITDSIGIGADYAWGFGFDGSGLRVSDVEYGWNPEHEEFEDLGTEIEAGQTIPQIIYDYGYDSHGTAVWGEIGAHSGDYGVTGAAYGAQLAGYIEYSVEEYSRRPAAILSAAADSSVGDLVLLEMQVTGPGGDYGPAELDPDVWDAVRLAVDAGVVVVAAAGNGSQNLDSSAYSDYRSWGDSGAIIVGAGSASSSHDRLYFSTYGARVDVQGFGESVFTTGYGGYAELGGDKNQRYTSYFSGTSSASPIVTAAATLVQHAAISLDGVPLSGEEMRDLLIETGIPQGSGGEIGPLPDVPAAIMALAEDIPLEISIDEPGAVSEGELPELTFTLDSEDFGVEFEWALEDGTPISAFPDDGVYTVTLTAVDDLGRSATDALEVTVLNVAPTLDVSITAEPVEGRSFTARSGAEDVAADTVTVSWWIDGEEVATGEDADLTFDDQGTFELTVVASDEDGGETSWSDTLTIANADPFIIDIDIEAAAAGSASGFSVMADDVAADTLTVVWDFGDGSTGEGADTEHTYGTKGAYTVSVTVTDEDGGSATAEEAVTIEVSGTSKDESRGGCSAVPARAGLLGVLVGLVAVWRRRSVRDA